MSLMQICVIIKNSNICQNRNNLILYGEIELF